MKSSYPQPLPKILNEGFTKNYEWLSDHLPHFANIPIYDLRLHIQTLDKEETKNRVGNGEC
jgi:hypothetical protein